MMVWKTQMVEKMQMVQAYFQRAWEMQNMIKQQKGLGCIGFKVCTLVGACMLQGRNVFITVNTSVLNLIIIDRQLSYNPLKPVAVLTGQ